MTTGLREQLGQVGQYDQTVKEAFRARKEGEVVKEAGETKREPVEVWLTKRNIGVTCRVVKEDETVEEYEIESLSMRGAQREITGYFKKKGYEPAGRWDTAHFGEVDESEETVRLFR